MSEKLEQLREEQRSEIEVGLEEAEQELAELEKRRDELQSLISAARRWLGEESSEPEPTQRMQHPQSKRTLHEAMEIVLREHPAGWGGI